MHKYNFDIDSMPRRVSTWFLESNLVFKDFVPYWFNYWHDCCELRYDLVYVTNFIGAKTMKTITIYGWSRSRIWINLD